MKKRLLSLLVMVCLVGTLVVGVFGGAMASIYNDWDDPYSIEDLQIVGSDTVYYPCPSIRFKAKVNRHAERNAIFSVKVYDSTNKLVIDEQVWKKTGKEIKALIEGTQFLDHDFHVDLTINTAGLQQGEYKLTLYLDTYSDDWSKNMTADASASIPFTIKRNPWDGKTSYTFGNYDIANGYSVTISGGELFGANLSKMGEISMKADSLPSTIKSATMASNGDLSFVINDNSADRVDEDFTFTVNSVGCESFEYTIHLKDVYKWNGQKEYTVQNTERGLMSGTVSISGSDLFGANLSKMGNISMKVDSLPNTLKSATMASNGDLTFVINDENTDKKNEDFTFTVCTNYKDFDYTIHLVDIYKDDWSGKNSYTWNIELESVKGGLIPIANVFGTNWATDLGQLSIEVDSTTNLSQLRKSNGQYLRFQIVNYDTFMETSVLNEGDIVATATFTVTSANYKPFKYNLSFAFTLDASDTTIDKTAPTPGGKEDDEQVEETVRAEEEEQKSEPTSIVAQMQSFVEQIAQTRIGSAAENVVTYTAKSFLNRLCQGYLSAWQ